MLINELMPGSELTINATSEDKATSLYSEVIELSEMDKRYLSAILAKTHFRACTAVSLFVSDHYTINFMAPNVQCDCVALQNNLPFLWSKVKIVKFNFPDAGMQHIIFSNCDAQSFNRRKDFRQWLGIDGSFSYGSPPLTQKAMIKDISVTGVGLLVDPNCQIETGTRIKIQFSEPITKPNGDPGEVVHTVFAKVVRIAAVNEKNKLLGTRIVEAGRDYVENLYRKQRESMPPAKGTEKR